MDVLLLPLSWLLWAVVGLGLSAALIAVTVLVVCLLAAVSVVVWVIYCGLVGRDP